MHDRLQAAASRQGPIDGVKPPSRRIPPTHWVRLPFWLLALGTGAKSFVDNPLIGSRRLNRAGLHAARLRLAHRLAWRRRARLAASLPADWRDQFDRDGFVTIPDFLPPDEFEALRDSILGQSWAMREHRQGDTLTRRVPIDSKLLRRVPGLGRLLQDRKLTALLDYVSSSRSRPIFYVQAIAGGVVPGPPDPQIELHSDTFHPSLKAWLFLTDVADGDRPLTYVAGSHRLTPERLEWERGKSLTVAESGDRLSQRGSFRVDPAELGGLGLSQPHRFAVPANTLVAVDTYGFHARADSDHATLRVEIWAYCRRTPFLPWVGFRLPLPQRFALTRSAVLVRLLDLLDRLSLRRQHWRPIGARRPTDP